MNKILVLLLFTLAGCASTDQRAAVMGTHESIRLLANASAQEYARCINISIMRSDEDECHAQKNIRAFKLESAEPYLASATQAIITMDMVAADTQLQEAQRLLMGLKAAVAQFIAPDDYVYVEWLE